MIEISPTTFSALTFLSGCISEWRAQAQLLQANVLAPVSYRREIRAQFIDSMALLEKASSSLNMPGIAAGIADARAECLGLLSAPIGYDVHRLQRVIGYAEFVVRSFMNDMMELAVFLIPRDDIRYLRSDAPFGMKVGEAFPSAAFDLKEAAKCRAFGLWTAAVMHLMRALEVALKALASHYDLDTTNPNWNTLLNQIEARSREIGKRTHGAKDEAWAAEAAVHLRFVKNAWRNHAMHTHQEYDEARSIVIYENCCAFMIHLSDRISEPDLLEAAVEGSLFH